MTTSRAAQEKPTSPRAMCGCACGCCEIMHPEREAAAATPSLDRLAAALYNRDYPQATESHADWFAATGDRQYIEEARIICGYLDFPATMRPEWATSWVRAARLDEGSATPDQPGDTRA